MDVTSGGSPPSEFAALVGASAGDGATEATLNDLLTVAGDQALESSLQSLLTKTDTLNTKTQSLVDAATTPVDALPPRKMSTDVSAYPTRTIFSNAGAGPDTIIAAAGAGKYIFITGGWIQVSADVDITFYSDTDAISPSITMKANDTLDLSALRDYADLYTGANKAFKIGKSTSCTVKGMLFTRTN